MVICLTISSNQLGLIVSNQSAFPYVSTYMLSNGVIDNKPCMSGEAFDRFNASQHVVWAVLIEVETGRVVAQTHITEEEDY